MRCKHLVQGSLIGDIGLVEDGSLAAEEFDAVKDDLGGIVETVDDDDFVAVLEQSQ